MNIWKVGGEGCVCSSFIHLVSYYGNLIIFLQFIPFQAEAKMSADLKFFKIINYISLSAYK